MKSHFFFFFLSNINRALVKSLKGSACLFSHTKTLQHFLNLGGSTQCSLQTTILEQSKVRGLSQETLAVLSKNTCSALYLSKIPFVCVCVCVCVWLEKHPGTWIRNSSSGHQSFPWLSRTTGHVMFF